MVQRREELNLTTRTQSTQGLQSDGSDLTVDWESYVLHELKLCLWI